jgi:NADH:ubiquinone oxidoreductase subunit E
MPGELARRTSQATVDRRTYRAIAHVASDTRVEQAVIRAKSTVGEFAVSEVAYLKKVQRDHEHANPDAGEAIAAIINMTVASIARSVAQFGSGIEQ